ncbi:hypothetical protein [Haloechinothrix salitolerans]|uniref:Uncharacterized protein n=1 Tax=Haloechinothrix salitolerans TaxID=926830 RepID=A0ABW2BY74_9PSEU
MSADESPVLEPDTKALLSALAAINGKVPDVALALLEGRMSPQRQREFADLLTELAELLRTHAGGLMIPGKPTEPADGSADTGIDPSPPP